MGQPSCRHFNGYKPCPQVDSLKVDCAPGCVAFEPRATGVNILLVHLGALGAVARSTALLPAIHRKYPDATLTWVTDRPGDQILMGVPGIHRVLTTTTSDLLKLRALQFDVALVVDKSLEAEGVLAHLQVQPESVFGFRVNARTGAVMPATAAASELWSIGISNKTKFFENRKTENQLIHEALELGPFVNDEYQLCLTSTESKAAVDRRSQWVTPKSFKYVVGLNTGCANTIAAKKLSIEGHVGLIKELRNLADVQIVLLGGREDTDRNAQIAKLASVHGIDVIQSSTTEGIRDGMISVAACDLVVSGDSFGLHLAIGLKRPVVAWFGPTCSQEIEIYGRGHKVETLAGCSPCWKRQCSMNPMCYDLVDFRDMARKIVAVLGDDSRVSGRLRLEVSPGL